MTHHTGTEPAVDWHDQAACVGENPELFYAGDRNPKATQQARDICGGCPVRTPCLLAAYTEGDVWTMRAGRTPRQRTAHLRKADGNVAHAVADALGDGTVLLQQVYAHHTQPADGGHVVWTDIRPVINVHRKQYTVHRLAWIVLHGAEPVGTVRRLCTVEGCVAKACLADRRMRDQAEATRKKAAA